MSRTRKGWFLFVILFCHDVLAVHHWRLSDDGKKIEAVPETPYALAYPGSLVDFIRQHDDVKSFGKSFKELQATLASISARERIDEPDIEQRVRKQSKGCRAAGAFRLVRDTLKGTHTAELCPEYHRANEDYVELLKSTFGTPPKGGGKQPNCANFQKMGYSEEHIWDFYKVKLGGREPDPMYIRILKSYFKGFMTFSETNSASFGEVLTVLLEHPNKQVSGNPYLFMAVAAYWRVKGHLNEACDCYKAVGAIMSQMSDAEVLSDPQMTREKMGDVMMLAMAVLLNKADLPASAAGIVNWFRSTHLSARSVCMLLHWHAVSGDVMASLSDGDWSPSPHLPARPRDQLEDALWDYKRVLELDMIQCSSTTPLKGKMWKREMELIGRKVAAIMCQQSITWELEQQRENLEKLLKDKLYFNEVYGEQIEVEEKIIRRMVSAEQRDKLEKGFEMYKYGYNPHLVCMTGVDKRFPYSNNPNNFIGMMACSAGKTEAAYNEYFDEFRKATLKNRPAVNDTAWKVAELFTRDRTFERKLEKLSGTKELKPSTRRKYPLDNTLLSSVKDRFWRRADWPNQVDCQAVVPKMDLFEPAWFPQTLIPVENKGYLVSDYLTKAIGLDFNDDHPFPWNEPYCEDVGDINLHPMGQFEGVREMLLMEESRELLAEPTLKTILVRSADRIMEDIEVAQRIKTLMSKNIGPGWIGLNLAGLYWRAKGNPRQATLCLIHGIMEHAWFSDLALTQLAQLMFKTTGRRNEAILMLQMAAGVGEYEPLIPYLQGRLFLYGLEVDDAIRHFKEALDFDPFDTEVAAHLLEVACSGKSSKPAISSRFPTVCCSPVVQNAVCFKDMAKGLEQCFVVDQESGKLIYNRCNGVYTGTSHNTPPYVNIVSPLLPIFETAPKREPSFLPFADDVGGVQTVETEELPLDYGGSEAFFAPRPIEWWSRAVNEMRYDVVSTEDEKDSWEEEVESSLAPVPPKPLSFLWVREKKEMLQWDVRLPDSLPAPSMHQIRRGLSRFPPKHNSNMCSGRSKLSVLLENQMSTWVSVTAKGEDIEKYVDLRGPVPGIAGLQPICPSIDKTEGSPILGMDHIPAFALSDQFLFYKPEKMLTDALKSLGNERDSVDHVAARLHTALLADGIRQNGAPVHWLLCVLSSLYWRVMGDAPRAVGCLQCALQTAPPHMRDVALISLANICHQAGLLHSALIAAGAALTASPNLVAIHFTIANIYASIGDYQRALEFYYSTLSLQSNFEPAKERIRAIYCHSGDTFSFQTV